MFSEIAFVAAFVNAFELFANWLSDGPVSMALQCYSVL